MESFFLPVFEDKQHDAATIQSIINSEFGKLARICDGFSVEIGLDKMLKSVCSEVDAQMQRANVPHKALIYSVSLQHPKFFNTYEEETLIYNHYPETIEQFKVKFKAWCAEFVETLKKIQKKYSWFEAAPVAKKVILAKFES